ncbi:hypothetical protein [Paenibacillus typhae]|uniref:hypothetical protein n=1 Tax=Paenibacillus typhae TaxID=1174501 RepID=UPI001C8E7B3F|nr:hypothetical protein [Paenibacillus typhae]MBY0014688.1 hypothetical protein [Paenibacillus typhae]
MKVLFKKTFSITLIVLMLFISTGLFELKYTFADSASSENLIINPGFENTTSGTGVADGWGKHGTGAFTITNSPVSGGYKAQRIAVSNQPYNEFSAVNQIANVVPGQSYTISGRFFIENITNAKVQLYADFVQGGTVIGSKILDFPNDAAGQYITLSGNGVVPNATSVVIYALIRSTSDGGAGAFVVDNVVFKYTNDSNLIANADFENVRNEQNNPSDWDYLNYPQSSINTVASPTLSGSKAQKISVSSLPANEYVAMIQKIRVNAGKKINISGALFIESLSNAKARIYVDFKNSFTYLDTKILEYDKSTNGNYITLSDIIQVPNDATYAVIYIGIQSIGTNGSGSIYADSFSAHYTDDGNRFINGDFESQGSSTLGNGWLPSYGMDTHDFQIKSEEYGNSVQYINASNIRANEYVGVSQLLKVTPNENYTIGGRFKVESINNAKIQLYADFFSAQGAYLDTNVVEYTNSTYGGYITISNTGKVPANAVYTRVYALIRAIQNNGSAIIYVDDMSFSYDNNLLSNANFEVSNFGTEIPHNWKIHKQPDLAGGVFLFEDKSLDKAVNSTYSSNGRLSMQSLLDGDKSFSTLFRYDRNGNLTSRIKAVTKDVDARIHKGHKSQKIFAADIPNNSFVGISQNIRVLPNRSFSIESYVNVNMLYRSKIQMYIDFYAQNGSYISNLIKETAEVNGKYTLLTNNGTVPSNAVTADVYFLLRSTGDQGAGMFHVDTASFKYN